jgi:hypothetical protein
MNFMKNNIAGIKSIYFQKYTFFSSKKKLIINIM